MRYSICFMLFILFVATARSGEINTQQAVKKVDRILQNSQLLRAAVEAGKQRTLLCQRCHGEDGNSRRPDVPNLAGQNVIYLLDQVMKFADGRRVDFLKNELARNFSIDDQVNIAIYYAKATVKPQDADLLLADSGKDLFENSCRHCHGIDGRGSDAIPRIAGQQIYYLTTTLKAYRGNNTSQLKSSRSSLTMGQVVQTLSDAQILEVANFIGQIP